MTAHLVLILQKQHTCQKDDDEEDFESLDGKSSEYDWLVIKTALEVIAALATALGPQFSEYWKIFESPVMKYASNQ